MKTKVLHLISQAHLDPVWLWPTQDGMAEALCTLQSAVDRCNEFPDFKFTRSSAIIYKWAKEIDPRLYASIKELVAQGRWEIIGNWIEQPDCNLPSDRSFQRQSDLGCAFFQKEFGYTSRIGYNPDSFGHAAGLPGLLKQGGMDYYACMRPMPDENPDIPLLFHWEGADGQSVLTQRIPGQYSQSYASTCDDVEARIRTACAGDNFADGFEHGVFWLGIGNHGGGPTREHLLRVHELQQDDSLPEIRFSTLQEYFNCVEACAAYPDLPVIKGELGYTLRGSYSATTEVKRLNRAAEKALTAAESLNASSEEPVDLTKAGWDLCYNQFHDILAGTCIAQAWPETRDRFGAVIDKCRKTILRESFRIARRIDTSSETGSVLFVLNPLPCEQTNVVSLDGFIAPHGMNRISHLETGNGERIEIQWTAADANFGPWGLPWGKMQAQVTLPAHGFQTLRVCTAGDALTSDQTQSSTVTQFLKNFESSLEPEVLPTEPVPLSLKDVAGAAWLKLLPQPVVYQDPGDTWGHGLDSYNQPSGTPELKSVECLSDGPIFRHLRQTYRWKASEIWMDVIEHHLNPGVDLRFRINWQEPRELLRLELEHDIADASVTARVPGATCARPNDGHEYAMLDWLRIANSSAPDADMLLFINDGCSSYCAREETVSIILCRSTPFAEHDPFLYKSMRNVHFTDMGWQECNFRLQRLAGGASPQQADDLADAFQSPPIVLLDCPHPGTASWKGTYTQQSS
jgi:alpha-mannosidase